MLDKATVQIWPAHNGNVLYQMCLIVLPSLFYIEHVGGVKECLSIIVVQNYLIGAFKPPCQISIAFAGERTRKQVSFCKDLLT